MNLLTDKTRVFIFFSLRYCFESYFDSVLKICIFPLFYGVTRGNKELGKLLTELEISKRSALEVSDEKIRSWSSRD